MPYLAFDLEIAKVLPANAGELKDHRPLGVACAATLAEGDAAPRFWYSGQAGQYASQMAADDVCALVRFLQEATSAGQTIVTWNGLGFDFDILAEESGQMQATCKKLALAHLDMFFHLFCLLGYGIGLGAVAKGLRLAGKKADVDPASVPQMWQNGQAAEVLAYLGQDVMTTLAVAKAVDATRQVRWRARSGKDNRVALPKWLLVQEALLLPEPDVKWMRNPWPRTKFTGWLEEE